MISLEQPTPATMEMVTHHLHPPWTAPIAHNSTQPAEQTAPHMIPIAPIVKRLDIGGLKCCSGKPLQPKNAPPPRNAPPLGHSIGSPDAHLGTTTATLDGVVKQMP